MWKPFPAGAGGVKMNLQRLWHQSRSFHPEHRTNLEASGLDLDFARCAGVFTLPPGEIGKVLAACGWPGAHERVNSVLIFLYPDTAFWRCKVFPALKNRKGQEVKYLQPKGSRNRLYIPQGVNVQADTPLWITEGEKKALKLIQEGFPCIGLGGVWSWRAGGQGYRRGYGRVIPDFDRVNWIGREVTIVFDSDVATNSLVALAERQLARELTSRGARVFLCRLPTK